MKRALISLPVVLVLLALSIWYFVRQDTPVSARKEVAKASESSPRLSLASDQNGRVRMIYAIVDRDGVYLGDQRVDFGIAIAILDEIAKKEKIQNVFVHVTDLARYGDAIRFYTGIDRSRFYVTNFPMRPVPIGYRLPVIGVFRKVDCCWIDEANSQELL